MNWKKWAPAIIAIVLGGAAAMMARNMMSKSHHVVVAPPKTIMVVASTGPLLVGQQIHADDVTLAPLTSATLPPDMFSNPQDVVGRVLTASIQRGQNIVVGNLAPKGAKPGLSSLVPPGMRAITVAVDEGNSQAGMVLPGCHVDVVATIMAGKGTITRTIASNVLIQGTGTRLTSAAPEEGKEYGPFHTVTLIVTPRDAKLIELASISARMHMLLRGSQADETDDMDDTDVKISELTGITDDGAPAPAPLASNVGPTTRPVNSDVAQTPKWTVEVIKGGGSIPTRVDFPLPKPVENVDISTDRAPAIPGGDESKER